MEENNEEQKILSGVVMDGVVDSLLTDIGELKNELEDEKEKNKKLTKEILEIKKPKSTRFWVKVYKDTDVSFLSFRDRGILFSLCQLVGNNKGGYLEDRKTGGIIGTWALLGKNIGIGDYTHTADKCKKLVERGILIVEPINDKRHIRGGYFRLNPSYVSIGAEKRGNG